MVMPANNTSGLVHYLAGIAPGSVGHLYTPNRTERPKSWLPYALDNGAFAAAINDREFNWESWHAALHRYIGHPQCPKWIVVPDVPFDGEGTVAMWRSLAPQYKDFGVPLALAVQNGMDQMMVKGLAVQPDVIFVGGTTEWKWATVNEWCNVFERVHVARVNGRKGLDICQAAGAESCDGSGWFRGRLPQIEELVSFIAESYNLDIDDLLEAARSSRHLREQQLVFRMEEAK